MTSTYETSVSLQSARRLEDAKDLFHRGEYVQYYLALESAALSYNPEAEYCLGLCYIKGQGVPPDDNLAAHWLLRAAEHGYLYANAWVAHCCIAGIGMDINYEEALKWLAPAVKQEDPSAMFVLGQMYCNGNGICPDQQKGLGWITKAAEAGFEEAKQWLCENP